MNKCNNCDAKIPTSRKGSFCIKCELMPIADALALLTVSRPTYYRMVRGGRIHPRHISAGRVLVPRAEIEAIRAGSL